MIVVESKPRDLGTFGLIDIKMWTTSEVTSDIITADDPMKMFVQVTRGLSPVLMAKVKVMVSITKDDGSVMDTEAIELFDNGNGSPDLTSGDGIYSRYLTTYPAKGRYVSYFADMVDLVFYVGQIF